jgi:hypothetical protein
MPAVNDLQPADLVTESDVEQKLIFPALTTAQPDGLGYRASDIATKHSLRRLSIDKGRSEKLYYPDYVAILAGLPVLVVEAKAPGESATEGYREARLYAAELNALYPHDINPCQIVVATNGLILLAGAADAASPTIELKFAQLNAADAKFASLVNLAGREALKRHADALRASIAAHPFQRPTKLIGGESVRNEEVPHNSFGAELALRFRRLFNPTTTEDRARVVREAYVKSKRRERFVDPIDRLIRGSTPVAMKATRAIEDTSRPKEFISVLSRGAEMEKQVVLLVGSVGSGKSTFVDYLQHVALDQAVRDSTVWIRVDLNRGPLNRELAYSWLAELVVEQLRLADPNVDYEEFETLERVFAPELNRLKKGPLKILSEASIEYRTRISDELTLLIRDPIKHAQALSRYICGPAGKLLVVVLDNCDKRNRDEQLLMFEVANWLQDQFRCLTILPIRDVTYDAHKHQPPLDTALKDLVFRIEPPLFQSVLQERIKLALRDLDVGKRRRQFVVPNGIRVDYPASDLGMYLACILRSLFEYDKFMRRVLSGIAGRDVRKALELFLDFCSSGHIGEDEILKIRAQDGQHVLPFQVVCNVLLRMDRRFYDGTRSRLVNLFQCVPEDALPDHFVRVELLAWLKERVHEKGPSGQTGYFRAVDVVAAMAKRGHDADRAGADLRILLARGCVVAEHQRVDALEEEDLVALSASGSIHLELATEELYLAACAEDVWYSDHPRAERIAKRIGVPRNAHLRATVFRQNAQDLSEYLVAESERHLTPREDFLQPAEASSATALREILKRLQQDRSANESSNRRICLRNVSFSVTREEVMHTVERLTGAEVLDCYLVERDGRRTGTAFVEFASSEEAGSALQQLDQAIVGGRAVLADVARERPTRKYASARHRAGR